ncbi:hypothetical protein [Zavarzinella formosa]|uniref:hypothetical protein n=1 Tax=Zavarzinella formosa TaxID=360055 RepID=UPI0002DAC2F3|nr:hypothetical protein [Zavarzinella formosa]
MSEYQYYEFRAVDKPLSREAMNALRDISSRAEITSTSLTNEYHYGDFKGNSLKLMEKYFDAHLYYANWGTRILMLRLPIRYFPLSVAEPYAGSEQFDAKPTKEHVILSFQYSPEDGGDDEMETPELGAMLSLRNDLLAGDHRCLYLGWLLSLSVPYDDEFDDGEHEDEVEPPVPPGLGNLSPALIDFAHFLQINDDLIAAAAEGSANAEEKQTTANDCSEWVAALPEAEKNTMLVRVMDGEAGLLNVELLQRFRSELAARSGAKGAEEAPRRRTVAELLARAKEIEEERTRKAAERKQREQERKSREEAAAREKHLNSLAGKEPELWRKVEAAITTKLPKQYDEATKMLLDLRSLADRGKQREKFDRQLAELRIRHSSKRSMIERLDKAGFEKPDDQK